jgi:hypothetical protein
MIEPSLLMVAKAVLLIKAIPRFIQLLMPLPPLHAMAQSRRGVTHILEVQMHLLAVVIPRFILIEKPLPPLHAMA